MPQATQSGFAFSMPLSRQSVQPMKDQTNEEPLDPMPGELPATTSRSGPASTWHGGKHGAVPVESGRNLDPTALRRPAQTKRNGQAGRLTSLTGTARCGAACRVVWEGWQAQSCHPDPIVPWLFRRLA